MIFFKKAPQLSGQALRWLVGYFSFLLLAFGSGFRIFLKRNLDPDLPGAANFITQVDQFLVYSFWAFILLTFIFGLYYVSRFFSPLGKLIEKASSIKKGEFNIKKSAVIKESRGEWYQLDLSLNKIWKDLKRKKADVAKERGELEAILTAANDAILAVDRDLNIRYYNAPMALLFDQKEEGSWGKKMTEVIRNQKIIEGFSKAIKEQKSQYVLAQQEMSIDSSIHHFRISISPFLDEESDRPRGAVALFHDITDHKRLEKVRMDFIANASHELKTPLTSIQGYLGLIKDSCKGNDQTIESFKVVESNMLRLNSIIQDLLELSKIESAESISIDEIKTKDVTERVIHELQGPIREKNQELSFSFESTHVRANQEMLEHVLLNLIENAVKYSPEKSQIKVVWGLTGDKVFLSVKDNGPGIESYHQGRLFERFYRVRDEQNQHTRGTGLGLSIVRNCMQKMNGSVDVKSAPGLGSEFICFFDVN